MVYPASSIRNGQVTGKSVTSNRDLETEQLHFDGLFERGVRCAPGMQRGFGANQEPVADSANSGHNQLLGEIAEDVASLNFPQEQEITQERKFAPRAAEDRSHALPRDPGSSDS